MTREKTSTPPQEVDVADSEDSAANRDVVNDPLLRLVAAALIDLPSVIRAQEYNSDEDDVAADRRQASERPDSAEELAARVIAEYGATHPSGFREKRSDAAIQTAHIWIASLRSQRPRWSSRGV